MILFKMEKSYLSNEQTAMNVLKGGGRKMTNKNNEDIRTELHLRILKKLKKSNKLTCFDCKNQTFILAACSDFPFFDIMCSKCGSVTILPAENG